jgi:signal recognition particle receptor subunit beta
LPTLDTERGVLIVRVVYDGPPLSGKTTTLRALAQRLGVGISSPEEKDGRTLFFDWVEYVGGLFEGRQIRCQIVSVPGQKELANRRRKLLESADAVVMVADTRAGEVEDAYALLRDLLPWCRAQSPPVGVVVQANKRDAPDSVPRAAIHAEFERIAPLAVIDTVATTGEGVREAFVFAVRLALDRVRVLAVSKQLREGRPDADSADELLHQMQPLSVAPVTWSDYADSAAPGALATPKPPELFEFEHLAPEGRKDEPNVGEPDHAEQVTERVFVPDPSMPGGFIWPPVDGRTLLHEVAQLVHTPVLTACGDWWAAGQGWRFHSAATALFRGADVGRQQLIEWARLHAANVSRLSTGRSVILADAGGGRYRLWQLVRVAPALRDRLITSIAEAGTDELAHEIAAAAFHLLQANSAFRSADVALPCTLWTVSGALDRQPTFVGLMPRVGTPAAQPSPAEVADAAVLEREFSPLFLTLKGERNDFAQIVAALGRQQANGAGPIAQRLSRMASMQPAT